MRRAHLGGVLVLGATSIVASYLAMRCPTLEERERALAVRVRRPRGPVVDHVVSAATDLGSMFAVAGTAGVLATSRRAQAAVDVAVGGMLAWSASQGLKPLVRRPRPYQLEKAERLVAEPSGSSWPSAHPAVAAAVLTVLAPRLPRPGRTLGTLLAAFVATSRVYVGVHYPTDVVAGLGLGGLCGALWRLVARRLQRAVAALRRL
ncbi:MAG: phosphatase PAP2 family protein [Actinomycetota bacterium]|nr:phosphatase PAP2 family protein [Actinomycetota bacterium]